MKKGWEVKRLGEIATFSQGIQVGLEQQETKPKDGYVRFIRIVDYTQDTDDIRYVPNPGAKYFINEDDIVMVRYGTPGLIGRGKAGVIANNLFRIKLERRDLTNDYLTLFLSQENIQNYLSTQGSSTMPALNFGQLKTVEVRFPPLQEQQRIVAILDKAFTAISKLKANAEQNLKNSRELFESYLQGVFENRGEGWEEKCLDELGIITSSKRIYKSEYVKSGVPFYRTKEIKELSNGNNITLELFISKTKYEEIKKSFGVPQINDLLMSAVGTIGEILVVENDNEFYFKDGNIVWFKEFKSLNTNYLKYALTAFVEKIKSLAIGAAYSALTIEKLNKYKISFPKSIETQQAIVAKLDDLSAETKKLESIYQHKINNLDELKKSILQKAFNGELDTESVNDEIILTS